MKGRVGKLRYFVFKNSCPFLDSNWQFRNWQEEVNANENKRKEFNTIKNIPEPKLNFIKLSNPIY